MGVNRLLGHLRRQDWAAVAIEFVIVVAGVFLGLQASNWNEERVEAQRAHAYLVRIEADIEANIADDDRTIAYYTRVQQYAQDALAYAEKGVLVDGAAWATVLAFYQAGQVFPHPTSDATYREMTSTGTLPLIRNEGLARALGTYYGQSGQATSQLFDQLPAYRETVRGLTPSSVQRYIWANCYRQNLVRHDMIDCPPGASDVDSRAILSVFMADPQLLRQLRYWSTQVSILTTVAGTERAAARTLAAQLAEEVGR